MDVTLRIPDDLAARLCAAGADLERRALEALALTEYQVGHLTLAELRQLLDLSRYELDGFLKAHGVFEEFTLEDLEQERQTLDRLGI
jgi:predicted HTH domain antitoxin